MSVVRISPAGFAVGLPVILRMQPVVTVSLIVALLGLVALRIVYFRLSGATTATAALTDRR